MARRILADLANPSSTLINVAFEPDRGESW